MRKFLSQFTDKRPNESTEKAAELFTAAATKWKIGQEFKLAANAFEMANKCFKETENPYGQVQVRAVQNKTLHHDRSLSGRLKT